MKHTNSPARFSGWLRHALANIPFLYRVNIHRRLTLCFIFVIVLMLVGNGVLLWQLHLIRVQAERLNGVNEELIEVLRVHTGLLSVYERLGVLARSEDSARLLKESATLRKGLLDDAQRTLVAFNRLPPEVKVDQTVLPTLESIERTLPSHLDAITAAAASGDWDAVRFRIERQVQPLESLSSELVKDVTREVEEQRAQAALNISRAERRIFLAVAITGFVTLLIAAGLGVAITRSITEPLGRVVEGSKALARGEFGHQISVVGADELAHLGLVFNDTARKLRDLYEDLRGREKKLRRSEAYLAEAQKLTHTGSWVWNVRTDALFWSQEVFRIYDYDPEKMPHPTWGFFERVHPEDRPRFEQRKKRLASTQEEWTDSKIDFRIVLPDGTIKHLQSIAHPVIESGDEIVGTVMDVTEQWKARAELEEAFDEIKQRTEALRRSEAYLAEAQRLARTGSWAYNPATEKCIYWSDEMRRIFGIDLQTSKLPDRQEFLRLVHPEDRDRFNERIEKSRREKSDFVQDYRVVLTDGTVKHIHGIGHPVLDETGNIIEYVGSDVDVTERKHAEENLRRSEADLLEAQRISKTGSWKLDVSSGRVIVSPEIFRIFGVKPDEGMSTPEFWLNRNHPEDAKRIQEVFERATIQKTDYEADYRIVLPDGTIKHLHAVGHPVLNESGDLAEFVGTAIDVTERKQKEEALRRSEGYLAEAQKLTHTGSWAVRVPQMENVYWSKEMYRIFGLDPGLTPPSYLEVAQRLHPEDARHYTSVVEQAVRERTDFEIEFRLLLPNGAAKYIRAVGHPVVNVSGNVIELIGTAMDVTEQREARAALETAFEQIKAEQTELRRMTDAVAAYIYVLRPDGTALYANQTVLDYTGLTLEDVQKEDQRARIFHPEDLERLREERREALALGKPFELEQRALGKGGSYRWFLVRYSPLRDDQGHIIRWYATGTDIEDRKRAEERMRDENLALREQIDQAFMFEDIVGSSAALQTVLSSIVKVAPTDSTVLITGETGTGKELIARAIHKHSQRSGQAFISVNCASIPSSLIASELFGHEKGAFTGAVQRRQGRFELAHSGTIFLDEVGDVPAETQVALLRVLQERQFERVGGNRLLPTDVRVIAATNSDLTAAIDAGTFRSDLFYRLNVFPIEVPPLRKRKEDIPMLVEYFVKRYAEKAGKQIRKIDNNTLELCQSYAWPGNIRELQNIVERSVILTSGDTFWIEKAWLASPEPARQELAGPLPDTLQNQEKEMIETALAECKGKVAGPGGAAAKLGIPRSTLDSKIKQLKIKKHKFIPEL
jgi:PAS domain S-box-containing protein